MGFITIQGSIQYMRVYSYTIIDFFILFSVYTIQIISDIVAYMHYSRVRWAATGYHNVLFFTKRRNYICPYGFIVYYTPYLFYILLFTILLFALFQVFFITPIP
ncbi:pI8L [African swine fever virus]|uniref:PI8L n=1 Tax=African swine fever virus TaxID=10497 RepID=A0A8A1UGK4_ASF|nr:pI8L [African swine fever virus]